MTFKRGGANPKRARNIELAKIHMAATALQLIRPGDDSAYRDMLWSIARVRSAKDLDAGGREQVLAHLRSVGWNDTNQRARPKGSPQSAKIRRLWESLHEGGHVHNGSHAALRAYCKRMSAPLHPARVGYDAPELMPEAVAQRVIEILKAWCERVGVPTA